MPAHPIITERAITTPIVTFACAILLLGQTLFALHQIGHISHPPHDDVCELCVIGAGIGSLFPTVAPQLLAITASATPPTRWLNTICRDGRGYHRYLPRAPPTV